MWTKKRNSYRESQAFSTKICIHAERLGVSVHSGCVCVRATTTIWLQFLLKITKNSIYVQSARCGTYTSTREEKKPRRERNYIVFMSACDAFSVVSCVFEFIYMDFHVDFDMKIRRWFSFFVAREFFLVLTSFSPHASLSAASFHFFCCCCCYFCCCNINTEKNVKQSKIKIKWRKR